MNVLPNLHIAKAHHGVPAFVQVSVLACVYAALSRGVVPVRPVALNDKHSIRKDNIAHELAANSVLRFIDQSCRIEGRHHQPLYAGRPSALLQSCIGHCATLPTLFKVIADQSTPGKIGSRRTTRIVADPLHRYCRGAVTSGNAEVVEPFEQVATTHAEKLSNGTHWHLLNMIQTVQQIVDRPPKPLFNFLLSLATLVQSRTLHRTAKHLRVAVVKHSPTDNTRPIRDRAPTSHRAKAPVIRVGGKCFAAVVAGDLLFHNKYYTALATEKQCRCWVLPVAKEG